jgi:hypothetical protein
MNLARTARPENRRPKTSGQPELRIPSFGNSLDCIPALSRPRQRPGNIMMSSREAVGSSFFQTIPTHKTGTERIILVRLTSLKLPAHPRHARHALWQRSHHRIWPVSGSPRRRLAGDRRPVIPVRRLLRSKAAERNACNTDFSPIRSLFKQHSAEIAVSLAILALRGVKRCAWEAQSTYDAARPRKPEAARKLPADFEPTNRVLRSP